MIGLRQVIETAEFGRTGRQLQPFAAEREPAFRLALDGDIDRSADIDQRLVAIALDAPAAHQQPPHAKVAVDHAIALRIIGADIDEPGDVVFDPTDVGRRNHAQHLVQRHAFGCAVAIDRKEFGKARITADRACDHIPFEKPDQPGFERSIELQPAGVERGARRMLVGDIAQAFDKSPRGREQRCNRAMRIEPRAVLADMPAFVGCAPFDGGRAQFGGGSPCGPVFGTVDRG